jgi:hypothetical protein
MKKLRFILMGLTACFVPAVGQCVAEAGPSWMAPEEGVMSPAVGITVAAATLFCWVLTFMCLLSFADECS